MIETCHNERSYVTLRTPYAVILSVSDTPSGHARTPDVERWAWFEYARISAVLRSMYSYARDSSSLCSAHSSRRSRRVALTGFLPLSHTSRRAAAGRYFLRLAMPVRALRALPVTARSGTYLPASLLGALLSPPQTRSLFLPPAAVAYLPQNDRKRAVILSVSDTPSGHARISAVERRAWFVYARISAVLRSTSSSYI